MRSECDLSYGGVPGSGARAPPALGSVRPSALQALIPGSVWAFGGVPASAGARSFATLGRPSAGLVRALAPSWAPGALPARLPSPGPVLPAVPTPAGNVGALAPLQAPLPLAAGPVSLPAPVVPTFAGMRLARVEALGGPVVALPPAAAAAAVAHGVELAAGVMGQALADSTEGRQDAVARDFIAWLASLGYGAAALLTCSPELVLAYLTGWLGGRVGRGGGAVGPSTVNTQLSLLSGVFTRLGRSGPYSAASGEGNPCKSVWVSDFRKGYARQRLQAGYQERSAVPLAPAKYELLCAGLWGKQGAAAPLERLVLLRDLLCVQFMWQTSMRGHDTGKLGLGDFVDAADPGRACSAFPLPSAEAWGPDADALVLAVAARGTKACRDQRAPVVLLVSSSGRPELSFPRTLSLYLGLCAAAGAPPGAGVRDGLFRPLRADRAGFKAAPLSAATLGVRVRQHLMGLGLYAGETCHSFRRGSLQAAAAGGASPAELHAQGQIKSPAVLQRYLDPSRHLSVAPVALSRL